MTFGPSIRYNPQPMDDRARKHGESRPEVAWWSGYIRQRSCTRAIPSLEPQVAIGGSRWQACGMHVPRGTLRLLAS
jgi:hypothetical protein